MKKSNGFTIIELLIAIAVVLLVLGSLASLFLSETKRKTCADQLGRVQDAALASRNNPGDVILCRNARSLTIEYNKDCGDELGKLILPTCE